MNFKIASDNDLNKSIGEIKELMNKVENLNTTIPESLRVCILEAALPSSFD